MINSDSFGSGRKANEGTNGALTGLASERTSAEFARATALLAEAVVLLDECGFRIAAAHADLALNTALREHNRR